MLFQLFFNYVSAYRVFFIVKTLVTRFYPLQSTLEELSIMKVLYRCRSCVYKNDDTENVSNLLYICSTYELSHID